ncbi:MAG: glycerophosphodiester phosphodiesterase family protein [Myxococcota bacterium]|nr:glycerophosphodiester phosphodiesterase family protein [Myxococcota bacterium]
MIAIALGLGTALGTPASEFASRHEQPVVVAHRGASALAPENTVAAIEAAVAGGASAVEFDIRQPVDGEIVVIHDATLGRTTNGRGRVNQTTWSTMKALDAGSWFGPTFTGEPVPNLGDALDALGERAIAAIEIKTKGEVIPRIRRELSERGMLDRAIFFSFLPRQIRAAREHCPSIPALLLIDPPNGSSLYPPDTIVRAVASGATLVGLKGTSTTPEIVAQAHGRGLPVFVYTVDEPAQVKAMVDAGVDGIITNKPRATETRIAVHGSTSAQRKDSEAPKGADDQ